jgi:hypothetical protein
MFQNYQHRGEVFRQAVRQLTRTGEGGPSSNTGDVRPKLAKTAARSD